MKSKRLLALVAFGAIVALGACNGNGEGGFVGPTPTGSPGEPINPLPSLSPIPSGAPSTAPSIGPSIGPSSGPTMAPSSTP